MPPGLIGILVAVKENVVTIARPQGSVHAVIEKPGGQGLVHYAGLRVQGKTIAERGDLADPIDMQELIARGAKTKIEELRIELYH